MLLVSAAMTLAPGIALAQQAAPAPTPAAAQPAEPAEDDEPMPEDIIVKGARTQPGAVVGDIPPEQQLSPADIRSYGVGSLNELLTELSPQTRSDRGSGGAPVVLLNGRRIGSFNEIRDIPTEAIQRVDILPEEVALKYGYPADQRVVNVVLRRRFRAVTAEVAGGAATDGGRGSGTGNLDLLHIRRDTRLNLHLNAVGSSALTEDERDIALPAGSVVDERAYRTLLPSARTFSGNAVYARPLGDVAQLTVNGRLQQDVNHGLQGLFDGTSDPLRQNTDTLTGHLGASLTGQVGKWRWSSNANYDSVATDTDTDVQNGGTPGRNVAHSLLRTADFNSLASGAAFSLPAGDVLTSIRVGASVSDLTGESNRFGATTDSHISRDIGSGQLNVDVPITSKRSGFGGAIGDLSLNGNFAAQHLSDFGTLTTVGYGANWSPIAALRFIASVTHQDDAPTPNQLGNPVIITPNARVFDFTTGQTVDVTQVTGGNPALLADRRRVIKLGLTAKPFSTPDLTFIANYISTSTDDPIASFPGATAAIQAAFPDRFTRDASGTLTRIDTRPVNFARSETSELRYGFNLSIRLKSTIQKELEAYRNGAGPNPFAGLRFPGRPRDADRDAVRPADGGPPPPDAAGGGAGPDGPRGGGGGFRGGGGGGRFGGGAGQAGGRLQFALYHTWHFKDQVLVRDGGPLLDLLNGDTLGGSGGQPRHELEGQAGYANNGIGARLSANWQSGTRVTGGTPAAPDPLRFSSLATFDLRLFADFGQRLDLVKAHPWLRGTRLTFSVTNLFNERQRVTDATGTTPIIYQPDYLDPLGRTVKVTVRKVFF